LRERAQMYAEQAERADLEARHCALNAHLCRDAAAAKAAAKRERRERRKAEKRERKRSSAGDARPTE